MIIIALGANLPSFVGLPEQTFNAALSSLSNQGVRIVALSSIWGSAPVPASDQPHYRNATALIETDLEPRELLTLLHNVEKDFGGDRAYEVRNAARTLDLDLIAYNDLVLENDDIILPHPRMHERSFVIFPLLEIAPTWIHPVNKRTVKEFYNDLYPDDEIYGVQNAHCKFGSQCFM